MPVDGQEEIARAEWRLERGRGLPLSAWRSGGARGGEGSPQEQPESLTSCILFRVGQQPPRRVADADANFAGQCIHQSNAPLSPPSEEGG